MGRAARLGRRGSIDLGNAGGRCCRGPAQTLCLAAKPMLTWLSVILRRHKRITGRTRLLRFTPCVKKSIKRLYGWIEAGRNTGLAVCGVGQGVVPTSGTQYFTSIRYFT